jgi:hypothetical protein
VAPDGNVYFATWKIKKDLPLQLIIFNPSGLTTPRPISNSGRYKVTSDEPPKTFPYAYHYPSKTDNSVFVAQGSFYAQELGFCGRTPLIPRNECAITALAAGLNGVIFGATSGERSHVFLYLPMTKRVIPLAVFGDGQRECRAMAADGQGRIFMGTMGDGKDGTGGHVYMYDAPAADLYLRALDDKDKGEFRVLEGPPSADYVRLEDWGEVAPADGVMTMAFDPTTNRLYGLTSPGGKFFICDPATRTIAVRDIFSEHIVKRQHIPRAMLCADGRVYFSGHHGYLIEYRPQEERFVNTGLKLPVGAGREYLNVAGAFAKAPDGVIYGGTTADGYLFRFDPKQAELVNLGKPSMENRIRALAAGRDGTIWGLCGADDELTHLFRYDPAMRAMHDLGMLRAKMPKTWTLHCADSIVTGADGEIYIGESDAISHLLVYYPPIEPRRGA